MPNTSTAVALTLLADHSAEATRSSAELGAAADEIWRQLTGHFAQLIGDAGVQAVIDRSISIARARLPWLAVASDATDPGTRSLRVAFERQSVADGIEGFGHLITTFIALLGRFIGDALVTRMLSEVWPAAFPSAPKESP
jgi:hypothetical protein